jgi:hypothetical protein
MQTGPTARHSPIGLFRRICCLVHLVRDTRVAAALERQLPTLHPGRRRARRTGNPRSPSTVRGSGCVPKAFGQRSRTNPGSSEDWPEHQANRLVCLS